jgi:VWFA-related protein
MFKRLSWPLIFLVPALCAATVFAQQDAHPTQPVEGGVTLDVVVTPKSGPPVAGLEQQDFTILDNKVPQALTSFHAVDGRQAPIEVILLVDAVNVGYQAVAYQRNEIDNFLHADQGRLTYPTALAFLTDSGARMRDNFSRDGNELSDALSEYTVALRTVNRSAGFWGAAERYQVSLQGLLEVVGHVAAHPTRKIILVLSPGWPLMAGPNVRLTENDQQYIFDKVIRVSAQLQQARVTLYNINSLGVAEAGVQSFYWKNFEKGISKPSQAQPGDLGLQVLAAQSGGLVLTLSNDLAARMRECVADLGAYYELSYNPPPGGLPREYHQIEIRVDKPGLTARTRQGYYSQP